MLEKKIIFHHFWHTYTLDLNQNFKKEFLHDDIDDDGHLVRLMYYERDRVGITDDGSTSDDERPAAS